MYQPASLFDPAFLILAGALVGMTIAFLVTAAKLRAAEGRNSRLENHVRLLQGATIEARDAFRRYAQIHEAKPDGAGEAKAMANLRLADTMQMALKRTGYRCPGPLV